RWPLGVLAVLAAVAGGLGALRPGPDIQLSVPGRSNPLGVAGLVPAADAAALVLSLYSVLLVAAAALALLRDVRSAPPGSRRRQQARWLAYGVGLASLLILARLLAGVLDDHPESLWPVRDLLWEAVGAVAGALLPVVLAVAVVRHRLLDIDRLIGRTVLLVVLSTAVLGAYLLVVATAGALLGPLLGEAGALPAALVGAGAAALVLSPLRDRVQRRVDRLLYGQRGDPYAVLSRLGRRLELVADADSLTAVVGTLREALRLGAVAIDVDGGDRTSTGRLPAVPTAVPLLAGGERVGVLLLGPRPGEDALGRRDLRLLRDLAGPIAGAVRASRQAAQAERLSQDLQLSRERLVLAREEERRRLRRDLHDGLGPVLAGMSMRADTAREIAEPGPVHDLLGEIIDDARTALADVRRLIEGMRPPALDNLGLAGAVEAHLAGRPRRGPTVGLDLPAPLPALPAATEVAAYRIALEAVANAERHADARAVRVTLAVDGDRLRVEVVDDGRGPAPQRPAGVGIASMRERAGELGGTCTVGRRAGGGTTVRALLPLHPDREPAPITHPEEARGTDPRAARR
ncbi:sensor histidine kinase, partial [Pseudonocardia lacus]|uniref:sensor histidine kinase n=1 Tax=Pseudonocardia lacus TaxID=2835865 RepID=UPI00202807A8